MRKRVQIHVIFFFLMLIPALCRAGEFPAPFFRRYVANIRPAEYGGESQIWSIENDSRGFLYLAAGTGLTVYDGYVYDNYTIDGYSVIRDLSYDSRTDRLYCAGDNFFGFWEMNRFGEMEFTCLYSNRDFSRNEIFWRIIPEGDNLFLQNHEAVYCYDFRRLNILATGKVGYLFQVGEEFYAQIDARVWRLNGKRFECISEAFDDRIVLLEQGPDDSFVVPGETSGFAKLVPDDEGICRRKELFPEINRMLTELKVFSAIGRHGGAFRRAAAQLPGPRTHSGSLERIVKRTGNSCDGTFYRLTGGRRGIDPEGFPRNRRRIT